MLSPIIPKINSVAPPHTIESSKWVVFSCWSVIVVGLLVLLDFFGSYKTIALFLLVLMCVFSFFSVKKVEQEQKKIFFNRLSFCSPDDLLKAVYEVALPKKERKWTKIYLKERFPEVLSGKGYFS